VEQLAARMDTEEMVIFFTLFRSCVLEYRGQYLCIWVGVVVVVAQLAARGHIS
jgi:hypothetical protein